MQSSKLNVLGNEIRVMRIEDEDYISLTDMITAKDGDFFVSDWLRNRNTLEFIGIWEKVHNPNFNYGEFAIIKNQAGLNRFKISAKDFIERTRAVGIQSKTGRYGGTYAHKDIAFEFGMWISPEFKIYLIKEFQRLKSIEQKALEWSAKRELAKINYRIHTDAIKENLIVPTLKPHQISFVYANEADMLNVALFGKTASDWKNENPDLKGNMRDYASVEQLLVLANLESYNAILIEQNLPQHERIVLLNKTALKQLESLLSAKIDTDRLLRLTKKEEND